MRSSAAACGGAAGAMHAAAHPQEYFPIHWANSRFFAAVRRTKPNNARPEGLELAAVEPYISLANSISENENRINPKQRSA
jgi:hypothetical protein